MVWDSNSQSAKGIFGQKYRNFLKNYIFKLRIQISFVMLEKYCQRLYWEGILPYLQIMTSRNMNLSTLTQYFIVIQFLFYQPA